MGNTHVRVGGAQVPEGLQETCTHVSVGGAQVPEGLQELWAAKRDVIISHDCTRIDFHGGNIWLGPRHHTSDELRKVTDTFVLSLVHHKVSSINVCDCKMLTNKSITAVATGCCPELKELNVANIDNLTDDSINAIAEGCPELKELNVALCKNLTDSSIKTIAKGCPGLRELNVTLCKNLTDSSMKAIAKGCPELKALNVTWCNLTDESIKAIATGCPELKELNVWGIENLTDTSIKAIAKGCPQLKELNVWGIKNLTDSSIKAIAKGCPELKRLNVRWCKNLTDESIKAIAEGCPELNKLNASSCNLTDSSIKAITKGCPELKKLDISYCRMSEPGVIAICEGCPRLEDLYAAACGLEALPSDFFERLTHLTTLNLFDNLLRNVPPSIVKHKHLRNLDVGLNPLQSPPYEIARQGVAAIKRYFSELEKGSSVSKLLKVVLVGDGEAGKTSLRNALAGRPNPLQKDRTIHLDIEKITLTDDLDINVYDCGGQEEYLATQLPYLTGLALYMVVVDAQYATDEYAHALEDKLHRFLVVLQNRVPGAVVLPIVTKVDTIKDPERRCHWLDMKIEKWLNDTRKAVCGNLPVSGSARLQPPAFLASVSDTDNLRNAGNSDEYLFIPLRVQSPALAVSVADAEDVQAVSSSVRALRDSIIALTKHNPPLLRGVGQKVPTTYLAVLRLFGAIAEYGDNGRALDALRDDTAHPLGESSELSPGGTYRLKDDLEKMWDAYRNDLDGGSAKNKVFDDATQLWEAQGLVFVDAGLVFLQPKFITTIVKPLVDHRHKEKERADFEDVAARFLESISPLDNDCYNRLIDALYIFRASGEFESSEESLFLSFLWRGTRLDKSHYGRVLQMLARSGVVLKVERDAIEGRIVMVVPFRLPQNPDETRLENFWPTSLPSKERELKLRLEPRSGFPTGLAERFVTDVHGLGTSLYSWRTGVVIKESAGYSALAERRDNVLQFTVRFEAHSREAADAAWNALCNAQQVLAAQRKSRFPGLLYKECFVCEECCRTRRRHLGVEQFDAQKRTRVFRQCGHCFNLAWKAKGNALGITNNFHSSVSHAQFIGIAEGSANYQAELPEVP